MSKAEKIEEAEAVREADVARSALLSDITELKTAEKEVVRNAKSKLPWVIGGTVGLFAVSIGIAVLKPKRRARAQGPSLLGKVARAAAWSAMGVLTRRLLSPER